MFAEGVFDGRKSVSFCVFVLSEIILGSRPSGSTESVLTTGSVLAAQAVIFSVKCPEVSSADFFVA